MNRSVGIIAEYNPFHNGHQYQIEKARELARADYVVIVMSGNFVQRGTPALYDKYFRAKTALLGGADLVLELPSCWATASAEGFASGAVSLLEQSGCADALCFGSESGDLQALLSASERLEHPSSAFHLALQSALKSGLTYPAARSAAAKTADPSLVSLLASPNNILGLEYIKALKKWNSTIEIFTVLRSGSSYHDQAISGSLPSATALRHLIQENPQLTEEVLSRLSAGIPGPVLPSFIQHLKQEAPVWEDDFSSLLQYQLLLSSVSDLEHIADVSPELARRIHNLSNTFSAFSSFSASLKTKELTYTRIQRALLHILLQQDRNARDLKSPAPYARILGLRREASPLLRKLKENSRIPVLTKAADYRQNLHGQARACFETDLTVSNLYEMIAARKNNRAFTNDIQKSPVIL